MTLTVGSLPTLIAHRELSQGFIVFWEVTAHSEKCYGCHYASCGNIQTSEKAEMCEIIVMNLSCHVMSHLQGTSKV